MPLPVLDMKFCSSQSKSWRWKGRSLDFNSWELRDHHHTKPGSAQTYPFFNLDRTLPLIVCGGLSVSASWKPLPPHSLGRSGQDIVRLIACPVANSEFPTRQNLLSSKGRKKLADGKAFCLDYEVPRRLSNPPHSQDDCRH